jgi:hypothetical protein
MKKATGISSAILITAIAIASTNIATGQEAAATRSIQEEQQAIDEKTAEAILRFLLSNQQDELAILAEAQSIDDLTPEQERRLLDLAKAAAAFMDRENNSTMFAN